MSVQGNERSIAAEASHEPAAGLDVWRLLAFTLAGFIAIMTETMPAGLLPQISLGLGVSESLAGQLVTLYALGSVAAAIPVIVATRRWHRRPLFLLAIGGLFVFNTLTALSTHYGLTLMARFMAGMASGVIWGLLAGYARRMVPQHLQGRALAVVGVGQPIALSLGVPLGTWLGTLFDWRGVFGIMSVLALVLFGWIRFGVRDYPGQESHQQMPLRKIFMTPGIPSILFVIFTWILAHNILYTYIAPFLTLAGLGHRVDAVLLLFGAASIAGIWITGLWVDRWLRGLTLASLGLFGLAAVVLGVGGGSSTAVLLGVAAWGLTFGGAPTLLQTAIADTAGDGADVAQSMLVTIFNLAVAGGGFVGGVLLDRAGAVCLPWVLVLLAVISLAAAWWAKAQGFKPGHRTHSQPHMPALSCAAVAPAGRCLEAKS